MEEETTAQLIKVQETMQSALQEKEVDEAALASKTNELTLISVHETLEGILKDIFNIEDGARLSSLQSY